MTMTLGKDMLDALRLLIDMIDASADETMIRYALRSFVRANGFSYFAYLQADDASCQYITNFPEDWLRIYRSDRYAVIDPVRRLAKLKKSPFPWQTSDWDVSGKPSELRKFAGDAKRHGVLFGVTIPAEGSFGAHLQLSFVGGDKDKVSAIIQEQGKALQAVLSIHYRLQLVQTAARSKSIRRLSPRELSCLRWSMKGKYAHEIAILAHLTPRTVQAYLDSARQKLGAANIPHLISLAKDAGLI
ncbi:LuxR family transcriptional regulator [Affinirhizobium pseudoryzae]|uniref:LuxR family transcriptional regulator n=1 Tax=Allorhizobium pseudoryzae TaxID=379684 RepID=UPI0013EBB5B7|nr:LuxR family transcriptional regulator [Allorhizobium pseudoryzae]